MATNERDNKSVPLTPEQPAWLVEQGIATEGEYPKVVSLQLSSLQKAKFMV